MNDRVYTDVTRCITDGELGVTIQIEALPEGGIRLSTAGESSYKLNQLNLTLKNKSFALALGKAIITQANEM